jgi:hypothetical protein
LNCPWAPEIVAFFTLTHRGHGGIFVTYRILDQAVGILEQAVKESWDVRPKVGYTDFRRRRCGVFRGIPHAKEA